MVVEMFYKIMNLKF